MKKGILLFLLLFVIGCKSTMYDTHPDVSNTYKRHNHSEISETAMKAHRKTLQKFIAFKEHDLERYNNKKRAGIYVNEDMEKELFNSWDSLIEIYEKECRIGYANRIDDVRARQYAMIIKETRQKIDKITRQALNENNQTKYALND